MVLRGWLDNRTVTLSLRRGALTAAIPSPRAPAVLTEQTVLALDLEGRPWSLYIEGHHFRRGLNGGVLAKWTDAGQRQRRRLWQSEAEQIVRRAWRIAQTLRDRLQLEASPQRRQVEQILARAAAFDIPTARADVAHYHRVYKPVGILPPDQYMALVLQITEGCSFNTCTFCSFYKDRPFRIKSPPELRAHIADVRAFLGASIRMRRGIFMADANALVVPQRQMTALLEVVNGELGERGGIYAFLDGFSGQKKSAQDYATLASLGLRRVYVGLESGHDPLLAWLRKPSRAADAIKAAKKMKAGGVNVGVIVMLGVGGERYAREHVRDTVDVVNQMDLGPEDLLYFSEFIPFSTPYETQIDAEDLWPLRRPQMQAQREAIVAGLRIGDSRPKIATYDIREFVY